MPQSGYLKIKTNSPIEAYAILDECNGNVLVCEEKFSDEFLTQNLNPDENYILQLVDTPDELSVCLIEPILPNNNDCANAILVDVSEQRNCQYTEASLNFAAINLMPNCKYNSIADIYYQFIAPEGGAIILSAISSEIGAAIYDSCEGTEIFCDRSLGDENLIRNLVPGSIYQVQFFSESLIDFEFCIEDASPTPNNTCDGATLINIQETNVCPFFASFSNVENNTFDKPLLCDGSYIDDDYLDVFYKIVVPESGKFTINVDGARYLAIYESCSNLAFYCDYIYNSNPEIITSDPSDTVICQLIGSLYENTFSICVEEVQPDINNDCSNAEWIEVGEFTTCSTNEATGNLFNNPLDSLVLCNAVSYEKGLFYQFVVPPSGEIVVDIDYAFALYQNCEDPYFYCNPYGDSGFEIITLEAGDTITIQILGDSNDNTFTLCIEEAPEIVNDTCIENLSFANVNDTLSCDSINSVNFGYYTLSDTVNCFYSTSLKDAYYNLIVPTSGRFKFSRASYFERYGVELYDKCNGELLWCGENSVVESEFRPGDTLILRIISRSTLLNFCIENAPSTPNNNCADASFIEVLTLEECKDENFTQISLQNNTSDSQELCNEDFLFKNAFYKLIVPQNRSIYIETENIEYIALYQNCDSLIAVKCNTRFDNNSLFQNLPAGDMILVELSSRFDNISFCISEVENALNNFCNDAIDLPVLDINDCFSNFTMQNNYVNTLQFESVCEDDINSDVYFKFIVPDDGAIKVLLENESPSGVTIYESCSMEPLYCSGLNDRFNINNLPANDTLILQVFSSEFATAFDICIAGNDIVANNVCEQPTNLNVYNINDCEGNLIIGNFGDYNSTQELSCSSISDNPDAYFQFVVPESGIVQIISQFRVSVAVYDECNSEEVFCDSSVQYEEVRNLSVGDTLVLMVKSRTSNGDFGICLQEVEPPANDICLQAELIKVLPFNNCVGNNNQSVSFNFNNLDVQPSCAENALVDAFFQFTVPASGQVRISNLSDEHITVYSACNGLELFCKSYIRDAIIQNLPVGENVILQLSDDTGGIRSFCIEEVPVNENNICESALSITVTPANSNCEDYLKEIYPSFNTLTQIPACYDGEDSLFADLFFEFQVPENGKIRVITNQLTGLSIYNNCNSATIFCEDAVDNKIIEGLPPGETLFIQTYHYNTSNTTLCLAEIKQSENDLCENATLIDVPLLTNGNLSEYFIESMLSNNTLQQSSGCADADADTYYQAVVPASGKLLVYLPENQFLTNKVGLSIYSNCGSEELYCNSDFVRETFDNLPSGDTIILQFYQQNPSSRDFLFLVGETFSNNNCDGAWLIKINSNENCNNNEFTINNEFYTLSQQTYCFNRHTNYVDAFFEIVVPENGRFLLQSNNSVGIILLESCSEDIIYCSDFFSSRFEFDNLPANDTLILQILTSRNTSFCLSNDTPSSNNNCSNALPITINENEDCSDLIFVPNAINTTEEAPSCDIAIAADLYYQVHLSNIESIFINIQNKIGSSVGAVFYDSCGGDELLCIENISNKIVDDLPDNVIMRLTQDSPGNFNLCLSGISSLPVNDNCIDAINLCNDVVYSNNQRATYDVIEIDANCNISRNNGLWYEFTSDDSGDRILVEILQGECSRENNAPNLNAFISSQSCIESYEVVEDCITYMQEEKRYQLILESPEPNTDYWVFVGSRSNIFCNFTISASGGVQTCDTQPCQAFIGGKVIGMDNCNVSGIEIIIKNENGETIETLTTDEEGNYSTTVEYNCGTYTIELNESTIPTCYNGNIEPVSFELNDDGQLDGVDFIDIICTPPNAGTFHCDE